MNAALNVIALVLVLAVCWIGMQWLAGRVHRSRIPDDPSPLLESTEAHDCPACGGVGAVRGLGPLRPCPECQGTGSLT